MDMKKFKYFPIAFVLAFTGCMQPDEPVITSDNLLRDIKLSVPGVEGAFSPEEQGPYANDSIEIVFEGDPKTDLTKSKITISMPNNAVCKPAFGGYQDLSEPYQFKVIGYDGTEKDYTVSVRIIPSVFQVRTLYTKSATEMGFTDGANRAVALSGNYFVVHSSTGVFNYYNVADASLAGTLSMSGIGWSTLTAPAMTKAFYMTSDDAGHIFAANLVTGDGGTVKMYQWDNVTATPKLLITWVNNQGGQVGRKFYVKGDVAKTAYIYFPVATMNKFVRFEVINGVVTSTTPDAVTITNSGSWDNNGLIVPTDVSKKSNYFTIGDYSSPEGWPGFNTVYNDGVTNQPLYIGDAFQFLGYSSGMDYIDFMGIKLLFQTELNAWNWMTYYMKVSKIIKDPTISTDMSPYISGHDWGAWSSTDIGANGNLTTDVKTLLAPDGESATIVYLGTNTGIVVKKLSVE